MKIRIPLKRFTFLFILTAIIASTVSAPNGNSLETVPYAKPSKKNVLISLIGTFPETLETQRERADASDLYRAPGEPIINEWFKVDGVVRGFLSISSFSRFTLQPSALRSKQVREPGDLSNVYSYNANLPPCFEADQTDCIYDFALVNEDGSILKAEPFSVLPHVTSYPNVLWTGINATGEPPFDTFRGNKSLNLPSGGDLWVWNVPNLNPSGISLYSASASLLSYRDPNVTRKFPNPDTRLQISPVEVDLPVCRLPHINDGCTWRDYKTGLDGAIFESEEISIKRSANNFTGKYRLGLKLSVPWTSWLISTVSGVDIQTSREGGNYLYEVSGSPSAIPTIRRFIPIDESYWKTFGNLIDSNQCPDRTTNCYPIISLGKFNINDQAFQTLEASERLIGSKASYMTKTWAIMSSSLSSYQNSKDAKSELQICSEKYATDRPAGITGSNATIFQHSPPKWDKDLHTFTYQVGAFQEKPDGSKFSGDYSLLVSTPVARCLWGVDVGTAKAALQVLSNSGEKQVATTIVNSDPSWLRFRASGFHFSSPKIVASVSKSSATKLATIICLKGKILKKVNGVAPKCPAGYEKK